MKPTPRKLVIDTNTARSAGTISDAPVSTLCRNALKAVRSSGHKVVFNKALREEWARHGSRYAMGWLTAMQQEGRVIDMTVVAFDGIRKALAQLPSGAQGRNALLKDFHIISAALSHDKILISNDIKLKIYIFIYSAKHDALGKLIWALPSESDFILWLESGAKDRRDWLISEMVPS